MRSARALTALVLLTSAVALAKHPHNGLLKPYKGEPPPITLSQKDVSTLKKGKGVLKQLEAKDGGRGMAIQDIRAPTDVVWGRILDFKSYPKMIDDVKECATYETKGDHIKTRFVIGDFGISYEYFIDHVLNKEKGYMTWTLDYTRESELNDSVGYWFVEKHPDNAKWTRLYYSVDIKIKGWLPGFIQNMIREEGLKRATEWVKRESEKRVK